MSFNGSGTFVINSAGQPVVSGTVISSTAFNALTADLANGLSTCITKDGQTTPTADIPMGSNKITGLANGTAAGDAANLGQVQSTVAKLLGSVSGADTITAVGSPTVAAYAAGQMFYFVAAGANTGAVTINIDSLGAKSITRDGTTALAAGDIQSGEVCVIVYDGTQFQLVNGASQSASIVTENLTVNKATVLNESGGDNDTRIEGDTDANLFFVDASANNVGIGTSSPDYKFHVSDSGDTIAAVTAGASSVAGLNLGNSTNKADGGIRYDNATDALIFRASNAEKMRIDSSGNVGLGVTPSAWNSGYKGIDITTYGAIYSRTATNSLEILTNAYRNSSADYIYKNNGTAQYIEAANGAYSFYTAASGTAGNTITFTQAMTLDASGDLTLGSQTIGLGVATPTYLQLGSQFASTAGDAAKTKVRVFQDTSNNIYGFGVSSGLFENHVPASAGFAWYVNNGEKARITSGGDLLVNLTGFTYSNEKFAVLADTNQEAAAFKTDAGATTYAVVVSNTASSGDNKFIAFATESTDTIRGSITYNRTAGLVAYNTTSDVRLKENIADAEEAGSKIDAMQVRQFDWKETGNHLDYGFVAQELHAVAPHAVSKPEDEEAMWSVDYSKLVPMLVKEIQTLRARVAALEAK